MCVCLYISHVFLCHKRSSFATLSSLRYLVVDEADKLLDQTFNQWLPKLLVAIATDKSVIIDHFSKGQVLLENTMIGLCGNAERLKLLRLIDFKVRASECVCMRACVYEKP